MTNEIKKIIQKHFPCQHNAAQSCNCDIEHEQCYKEILDVVNTRATPTLVPFNPDLNYVSTARELHRNIEYHIKEATLTNAQAHDILCECKFGQPANNLVPLDYEKIWTSFEKFLNPYSCGLKIKIDYAENAEHIQSWVKQLCETCGQPANNLVPIDEETIKRLKQLKSKIYSMEFGISQSDREYFYLALDVVTRSKFGQPARKEISVEEINKFIRKLMNSDYIDNEYCSSGVKTIDLSEAIKQYIDGIEKTDEKSTIKHDLSVYGVCIKKDGKIINPKDFYK